mgnify:CR=1 FL=1
MMTYYLVITLLISLLVSVVTYNFGIIAWLATTILFFNLFFFLFRNNNHLIINNIEFKNNEVICLKSLLVFIIIFVFQLAFSYFIFGKFSLFSEFFLSVFMALFASRAYRNKLFIRDAESETLNTLKKLLRLINN